MKRAVAGILMLVLVGCASTKRPPLPAYASVSTDRAIEILRERGRAVKSVSAEALLTLTRPDGESVRLDAAIVTEPEKAHARVRAWKFGRAVFDLTLNDKGVYLLSPEDSSRAEEIRKAGVSAAQLARAWSILSGGFFDSPALKVADGGDTLVARRVVDGAEVECYVDRATLVPVRYVVKDAAGKPQFTLVLDQYRMRGDMPWADRMTARSAGGVIRVEFRDVELNGELAEGAFEPPGRAEKLP
jgi:hypothetical protein